MDTLRAEVDAFDEHSPYQFEIKSLGNPWGESDFRVIVKVTEAPPIPGTWALITGDILTNIRAALDHAVFPQFRHIASNTRLKTLRLDLRARRRGSPVMSVR